MEDRGFISVVALGGGTIFALELANLVVALFAATTNLSEYRTGPATKLV